MGYEVDGAFLIGSHGTKEEAEEMAVLAQRGDAAWDGVGDSRQPQA